MDVLSPALTAGLSAVLLALLISMVMARRVTTPLDELVRGALDIARGRFGRQVAHAGRTELSDLAYTFNFMSRQLERYDGDNARLFAALERAYLETIRALASAIDAKDPYTRGHSERVAKLAVEIGRELGLDDAELRILEFSGILHDVGKIGIPEQVLQKPARLTPEEFSVVRSHAAIGAEIVDGVEFLKSRRAGHPPPPRAVGRQRLPGRPGRRVHPAHRPHRQRRRHLGRLHLGAPLPQGPPPAEAVSILAQSRGAQLDPNVHDAILRVLVRTGQLHEVGMA